MKKIVVFLAVCMPLLMPSFFIAATGQNRNQADFIDKQIAFNVSNATVLEILITLSVEQRIPIGIEHSSLDKYEPNLEIAVSKRSVKDVLDMIVGQAPFYRWELRDGVINFVPTQGRDPFLEKLLDTHIGAYLPKKGINKFELRNTLADAREVQRLLAANNTSVNRVSDYIYYPSIYSDRGVDLSIHNTSVRAVLNKIVRESEHKLWMVDRDDKKKTLVLGF